ncbi:hypothetical protein TUM12370_23500 [Salmonella enterica subsp. enterica serovar Choleraesuis]|nr:hypothetical protein TUM12370_23500 [Salmonella enterica subsp. enterica serovar Choleraesuis]
MELTAASDFSKFIDNIHEHPCHTNTPGCNKQGRLVYLALAELPLSDVTTRYSLMA